MTPNDQELKALWRDQEQESGPMTIEHIHARAFQSGVRTRNLIEYAACAIVIAVFIGYAVIFPNLLLKLGSVMTAVGAAFTAWQLHRRGSAKTPPANASAGSSLTFHRAELVRQRDAVRSVACWYIAPYAPGLGVFMAGLAQVAPANARGALIPLAALIVIYVVAHTLLHRRAARRLQAEIDDIDALMRG